MSCPLSLLRHYVVNNIEIIERDDQIIFGDFSWPKSSKTSYLMFGSGKNGTPKAYYTLGSMLYLLQNLRLPHDTYVRYAVRDRVPIIRRPDRKELLAYLTGITSISNSIDILAPLVPPRKVKRVANNALNHVTAKKSRLDRNADERETGNTSDNVQNRTKKRLAVKLNSKDEIAVLFDNSKSLSEPTSAEKTALIRANRTVKKRTTIQSMQFEDFEMDFNVDQDSDVPKTILSKERVTRTRATILQSSTKEFKSTVFGILKNIDAKERKDRKKSSVVGAALPLATRMKQQRQLQMVSYDRYNQQQFFEQRELTNDFVFDNVYNYQGMHQESLGEGRDARSVVIAQPCKPIKCQDKHSNNTPIIIVPSSNTSLITIHNAKALLQDMTYTLANKMKAGTERRKNAILLERHKGNHLSTPYLVVDNPLKLSTGDWSRVVAVFVTGPQWQFRGWPYFGNPFQIFATIPAFHLKYDEMPVDPNVARWAVKIIEINKIQRHLDRIGVAQFWETVDRHITQNKPYLQF